VIAAHLWRRVPIPAWALAVIAILMILLSWW
jgi:hypothetical protein